MGVHTFGSVYIGSYELSLKVFEFSSHKKMREIDHIRTHIDIGRDVYTNGAIGYEAVDEVCEVLGQYLDVLRTYRVDAYEVYASAAIREAENELFVLNQIQIRTGVKVKVLSNSEHRFVTYETVAGNPLFEEVAKNRAGVVDIGGSGIQITLFEKGALQTTQHLELGTIRLQNLLKDSGTTISSYRRQLEEFIEKKLNVFYSMYLKDGLDYIVIINDYCERLVDRLEKDENVVKADKFLKYADKLSQKSLGEISRELDLPGGEDPIALPAIILFKCLAKELGTKYVWAPGTNINDGIAYDYARSHNLTRTEHDFDADILSAARNLAEHFNSFSPHIEALNELSADIFETMKKVHGLGKRELLLLRVATILHDVGKYVSVSNASISAYHIIMESEIIGLTHLERQIVAYTVLLNSSDFMTEEELPDPIDEDSYLVAAKLASILRVANALDQSHKQKFENVTTRLKDRELVITLSATEDISLERAMFRSKTKFFEHVFSIKPVLKEKRVYDYGDKD